MGFILLLVAIILFVLFLPVGLVYAMLRKGRNEYFYNVAYGIDQLGNIVMQHAFNKWMISDDGFKFGNPDETVSSELGKNKKIGRLTKSGKFLDKILEKLDKGHSIDSIEEDEWL